MSGSKVLIVMGSASDRPVMEETARVLDELGIPLTDNLIDAIRGAGVVVISTDHSIYRMKSSELFQLSDGLRLVVDGRHVIEVDSIPAGALYVGVGRPWREAANPSIV